MPVQYPITLASETDLIAFLANYSTKEFYLIATERIYPAIKLNAAPRSRGKPGPKGQPSGYHRAGGDELTTYELNSCVAGTVLWQRIDGQWVQVEKTIIGHKAYWAIVEQPTVPPFNISL